MSRTSVCAAQRLATAALLALALGLALSGCIPQQTLPQGAEKPVVLVLGAPSATLIPYSSNLATRQLGGLIFQSLVDIDASGTPMPDLALKVPTVENGGVAADGRTVDFELDPAAKWHDGKPVTAGDVTFTFGLFKSGGLVTADPATLRRIRSVTALDDRRVRVTLSEADWPGVLRFMPFVLPQHLLEKSKDLVSDPFWDRPVGSGPYKVTSVARRRAVTLERVAADGGLDKITAVFHDTPAEELDTWDAAGRAIWPGASVGPVGSEKLSTAPSSVYRYWIFNVRPDHPTSSLAVRQLIASVVATAVPAGGGPWGASKPKLPAATSSVAALEAKGWGLGKDGILQKRGQRMSVVYAYNIDDEADGYALDSAIRALRGRGILDRRESTFAYGDYFDPGAILPSGAWDAARVVLPEGVPLGSAWPFDPADDPWVTDPGGLNLSGVDDAQLNKLAVELRRPQSPEQAVSIRRRIGERLAELCLVVPDRRTESRVLSRGLDGVSAAASEEDFMNLWASWRPSNAAEAR